ncbi:zinc ribbon domain-containing protein [Lachnoanaerobaculum sp. OBRC5-5]|uniref:zinc ribbon domain-containing protein n=1 Tax=Lachnoanaerobaculum sp. OBRC5-5 TaxID=936595 RepID=UPI0002E73C2C|nr:zinc ribbon domain-containing protein [Lachnoanaerobaculum sp. OBRC5-5]
MFCSNCGKQIEDSDKVCGFCGVPVQSESNVTLSKDKPDKTDRNVEIQGNAKIQGNAEIPNFIKKTALVSAGIYILSRFMIYIVDIFDSSRTMIGVLFYISLLCIISLVMIVGLLVLNSKNKIILAVPKIFIIISSIPVIFLYYRYFRSGFMFSDLLKAVFIYPTSFVAAIDDCVVFVVLCILALSKNKTLVKFCGFILILTVLRHTVSTIYLTCYEFTTIFEDLFSLASLSTLCWIIATISFYVYEVCIFFIMWSMSVCGKQAVNTVGRENEIRNVYVENTANTNELDEPSTGINVLCFFIPVIGLTLYFAWKNMYPKKAITALKVGLIGFLTWTVLSVVLRLSIDFIVYWMISNI